MKLLRTHNLGELSARRAEEEEAQAVAPTATTPTIMQSSVDVAPSRRAGGAPVRRRLRALARCIVAPRLVAVEQCHPPPYPPDLLALKAAYDRDGVRCSAHPRPRAFL